MLDLADIMTRFDAARTAEEAFAVFCAAMNELGYDRTTYTLITDHPSLGLKKQMGLSTTYPEDWITHYVENNYMPDDPVVTNIQNTSLPFYWDDMIKNISPETRGYSILQQGEDAGVAQGLGLPFYTPHGEITGIGLARTTRLKHEDYSQLAAIYFLSSYFHTVYRSLHGNHDLPHLTPREQEVLCWACEGKQDSDIAEIMTISASTVRYHWHNIFNKLSCYNKPHAVAIALRLHLIQPGLMTLI